MDRYTPKANSCCVPALIDSLETHLFVDANGKKMGGAQAGAMGLNYPRGRPDRVFRIRKEGTQYGDDDDEDDEYADDTALYTIWNRYIDEESGQPYYYNTETGDTSFKPPQKVREVLEKEMEEKALMESGADLPDELKVYAAQVEADAEERRLAAFKKEREEAAAEDQKHWTKSKVRAKQLLTRIRN